MQGNQDNQETSFEGNVEDAVKMLEGESQESGQESGQETEKEQEQEQSQEKEKEPERLPRYDKQLEEIAQAEARLRRKQEDFEIYNDNVHKTAYDKALQDLVEIASKDPSDFLVKTGLNLGELTQRAVEGKPADPNSIRIEALEKQIRELVEGTKRSKEQQEQTVRQSQIQKHKETLYRAVQDDPESFPFLHDLDPSVVSDRMYNIVLDHYDRTGGRRGHGEVLSPVEAAKVLNEAQQILFDKWAKRKGYFKKEEPAKASSQKSKKSTQHFEAKPHKDRDLDELSDDERYELAIQNLKDNLIPD